MSHKPNFTQKNDIEIASKNPSYSNKVVNTTYFLNTKKYFVLWGKKVKRHSFQNQISLK